MEFILPITGIEAFGDFQLSKYVDTNDFSHLALGYGSYAIIVWLFVKSIKSKGLAWSNAMWDGTSNLATGLVAIYILGESPTQEQLIGMALVSVGIFLIGDKSTRASKSA